MKKYLLLLSFTLLSCADMRKPSIDSLKKQGFDEIHCKNLEYKDIKSDVGSNPFYKIYATVEKKDVSLEIVPARCYDSYDCDYEIVEDEVICQKLVVSSKTQLDSYYNDHVLLVFNAKF